MNVELLLTALTHTIFGQLRKLGDGPKLDNSDRDRGAVSLEQVLWFVASGVAVAIDGQIYQDTLLQEIKPDSEIHVLPQIAGG